MYSKYNPYLLANYELGSNFKVSGEVHLECGMVLEGAFRVRRATSQ